jgi:hypothetical protein
MIQNSKQKWMNLLRKSKTKSTYQKVNFTLTAVLLIVLLLLFLGIISGLVRCPYENQFGIPCSYCGVSRDIFRYLRLDFATPSNPHSLKIFIFFIGQVFLRLGLCMSKIKESSATIKLDIIVSVLWIMWVFGYLLFG